MIFAISIQVIILSALICVSKNYSNTINKNSISDSLIINDQFTLDQLNSYLLLNERYSFELELSDLSQTRKLDNIVYSQKNPTRNFDPKFIKIFDEGKKSLYRFRNAYYGVTQIDSSNKSVGYILTKKIYNSMAVMPTIVDFEFLILATIGAFLFNFFFLFFSLKKKILKHTDILVKVAAQKLNSKDLLSEINISEYRDLANKILKDRIENERLTKDKLISETALRVAHDIRSPLTVMEIKLAEVEKKSLAYSLDELKLSVQEIKSVANNLLDKYRDLANKSSNLEVGKYLDEKLCFILLPDFLETIMSDKKCEWVGKDINFLTSINSSPHDSWVLTQPNMLKSTLSNLLNNANEASENSVFIMLQVEIVNDFLSLIISDRGKGMTESVLRNALNGISTKSAGNGFGLKYAHEYIKDIGGNLHIYSKPGDGTKVILNFPKIKQPERLVKNIFISSYASVLLIDANQDEILFWQKQSLYLNIKIKFVPTFEIVESHFDINLHDTGVIIVLKYHQLIYIDAIKEKLGKKAAVCDFYVVLPKESMLSVTQSLNSENILFLTRDYINDVLIQEV